MRHGSAKNDQEKIRLVETRNYVPRKTAFYATWLLFEEEATFVEFLEAFPHYGLEARLPRLQRNETPWPPTSTGDVFVAISISVVSETSSNG